MSQNSRPHDERWILLTESKFKKLVEQVEDYEDYLLVKKYAGKKHKKLYPLEAIKKMLATDNKNIKDK